MKTLIFMFVLILSAGLFAADLYQIPVKENIANTGNAKLIFQDQFNKLVIAETTNAELPPTALRMSGWNDQKYYFMLYPLRDYDSEKISTSGQILSATADFILFESNIPVLNENSAFHAFKIVRLFNEPILETAQDFSISDQLTFNATIQQMVNNVSADTIWNYIAQLQSMERYTTNSSAFASANTLKTYFETLGYDSVYFHNWQSGSIPNIVAVKWGKEYPTEEYIVGGHYDTYTSGAPGADDNGSGSASIMEIARVMANMSYKRTIKFILFSGEELGLYGSNAYATQAANNGDNILGMINMDMIAYVAPGDAIDVDVLKNNASMDLFNAYSAATNMYVPNLPIVNGSLPFGASSDHASFWNKGFKAIFPFEDSNDYSPYIHTSQDVLGTSANNQSLAEQGTQSVVATVATLAEIAETRILGHIYSSADLTPISNAKIYFNGDSTLSDNNGYFQTPPLAPGIYDVIYTAANFTADTAQFTMQQYQVQENDVYLIPVGQNRPFVHYQTYVISDDSSGASLGNGNQVFDAGETIELQLQLFNPGNLDGQNIEINITENSGWLTVIKDSANLALLPAGGSAVVSDSLIISADPETPANSEIPISVLVDYGTYQTNFIFSVVVDNRGLFLIINDDDNGGGLDAYKAALDTLGFSYDVSDANVPDTEMALYQNVIWFTGEDYSQTLTSGDQQKLTDFLNNGGNLFINGVDIGYDINSDPFYSNYLKANYQGDGPYTATTMVKGVSGDEISGQFSSGMGMNDNYVDQITASGGSQIIFNYDHQSTTYGCGVKYSGNYRLVYLTYSFENITNVTDRENLMYNIAMYFGLLTDIPAVPANVAHKFELQQNYPNPFNPETNIKFSVAKTAHTELGIFDVLGRKIRTLVNKELTAGEYQLKWDGKGQGGSKVASGFYFYRLKQVDNVQIKKLLLLK